MQVLNDSVVTAAQWVSRIDVPRMSDSSLGLSFLPGNVLNLGFWHSTEIGLHPAPGVGKWASCRWWAVRSGGYLAIVTALGKGRI